jgi:hypothetical protein
VKTGKTITVTGTTTLTDGTFSSDATNWNGGIEAQGNVTVGANWDYNQSNGFFRFGGSNNQTVTSSGNLGSPVYINKPAGTLTISGTLSFSKNFYHQAGTTVGTIGFNATSNTFTYSGGDLTGVNFGVWNWGGHAYFDSTMTISSLNISLASQNIFLVKTGKTITVTGTTTLTDGTFSSDATNWNGGIEAQGNVTVASTWDTNQCNGFLRFGGTADQVLTSNATFCSTVSSTKSGGSITNVGNVTFTKNTAVTFASGVTLDLNGYNFSLTGGFTMSSGSILKLKGSEASVSVAPTLSTGSTVWYYGTSGPYTMKSWTYTNANLIINGTAGTTVFTLPAALTSSTTTITSGILSLNGYSFTTTTFYNNDTLRLKGSEAISITNGMDTDSGTVEYVGDGDGVVDTYIITPNVFYNLKVNFVDTNDVLRYSSISGTNPDQVGLLGYWKGDGNANDSSGNNKNGTLTGGATANGDPATGLTGNSFVLGTNKYVNVALSTAALGWNNGSVNTKTVTFWAKGSGYAVTSPRTNGNLGNAGTEINSNGSLQFRYNSYGQSPYEYTSVSTATANTSAWNFYALGISIPSGSGNGTAALTFDVNNVIESKNMSYNGGAASYSLFDNIRIGQYYNYTWSQGYFSGQIDDVRIYNRILSNEELAYLYYKGVPPTITASIMGNLSINNGQFIAPTTLNLYGNLNNTSGTINATSTTLNLLGSNQTISLASDTTFASLTKTASTTTPTLTFGTAGKVTITGTTTLQGQNGNNLLLRSATEGIQWKIDPQATRTLQYLDVKDSWNTNATVINTANYTGLVNSGNNTGWTFGDPKPVLSSISPTSGSGGALITLTATGSDFVSGSYIKFGSRRLNTSYVDAQHLTAQFNLTTFGSFDVTVTTDNCMDSPNCTSDPQVFTVNPILSITSISPAQVDVGASNTDITIIGTNFTSSPVSTAYFSTTALSTNFVSSTQLTATIPSNLLSTEGTYGITVVSNSITSNAQPFTVGELGYKAFIYTKTFYGSASLRK